MDAITPSAPVAVPTPPTTIQAAGMSAAKNLAPTLIKLACGAAAAHGLISGGNVELYTSVGVAIAAYGYSVWRDFGKDIAIAGLTILRARVLNAAARANANPAAAAPALASVAAHVEATSPEAVPASPVAPARAS